MWRIVTGSCLLVMVLSILFFLVKNTECSETEPLTELELESTLDASKRNLAQEATGTAGITDLSGQSIRMQELHNLIPLYLTALELDPDDVTTLTKLASAWEALGEWSKAEDVYKRILDLEPMNHRALAGIKRIIGLRRPWSRVNWSSLVQNEYWPKISKDIYKWKEEGYQIQVGKRWAPSKALAIGWLEGTIRQENRIYHDTDFALRRNGPFFHLEWPIGMVQTQLRVRDETFEDDGNKGFYKMGGIEHLLTGYLVMEYTRNGFWANLSYSRERDPEPVYDTSNARARLNVEVQELTGLAMGQALGRSWEVSSSLYYELYGSDRPDQFNLNGQITHRPTWLPGLRVALGAGYYTEETETIVNLTTSYQWRVMSTLALRLEHQLEYSHDEDSWLNQGDLLLTWSISPRISFNLHAQSGIELGEDKDDFTQVEAILEFKF